MLWAAFGWAWWFAGGLIVACGVEDEVSDDLAGVGVDDGDVQVVDEDADVSADVVVAQSDVVELAGVAQGDAA